MEISNLQEITSREAALKAWDRDSVIIRTHGDYVFVYPMLGKGFRYPNFDLRRDCCLNNFVSLARAVDWADLKNYRYVILS